MLRRRTDSEKLAYLSGIRMTLELLRTQFKENDEVMAFIEQIEILHLALEKNL